MASIPGLVGMRRWSFGRCLRLETGANTLRLMVNRYSAMRASDRLAAGGGSAERGEMLSLLTGGCTEKTGVVEIEGAEGVTTWTDGPIVIALVVEL